MLLLSLSSLAPTTPRQLYLPNWDVREDESLYVDIPTNGGALGYLLLKGISPSERPSTADWLSDGQPVGIGNSARTWSWCGKSFLSSSLYYFHLYICIFLYTFTLVLCRRTFWRLSWQSSTSTINTWPRAINNPVMTTGPSLMLLKFAPTSCNWILLLRRQ